MWVFLAIALVLMVMLIGHKREKAKEAEKKATPVVARVQTVVREIPRCERGTWENRTFDIPATGLEEHLCPGWEEYPIEGDLNVTYPSGKVVHDKSGSRVKYAGNPPEGLYIFAADSARPAKQVTIYNRW